MFNRVPMDVIDVFSKVKVVAYLVFPEAPIPVACGVMTSDRS